MDWSPDLGIGRGGDWGQYVVWLRGCVGSAGQRGCMRRLRFDFAQRERGRESPSPDSPAGGRGDQAAPPEALQNFTWRTSGGKSGGLGPSVRTGFRPGFH